MALAGQSLDAPQADQVPHSRRAVLWWIELQVGGKSAAVQKGGSAEGKR
jgi:hypothetical protein